MPAYTYFEQDPPGGQYPADAFNPEDVPDNRAYGHPAQDPNLHLTITFPDGTTGARLDVAPGDGSTGARGYGAAGGRERAPEDEPDEESEPHHPVRRASR